MGPKHCAGPGPNPAAPRAWGADEGKDEQASSAATSCPASRPADRRHSITLHGVTALFASSSFRRSWAGESPSQNCRESGQSSSCADLQPRFIVVRKLTRHESGLKTSVLRGRCLLQGDPNAAIPGRNTGRLHQGCRAGRGSIQARPRTSGIQRDGLDCGGIPGAGSGTALSTII